MAHYDSLYVQHTGVPQSHLRDKLKVDWFVHKTGLPFVQRDIAIHGLLRQRVNVRTTTIAIHMYVSIRAGKKGRLDEYAGSSNVERTYI